MSDALAIASSNLVQDGYHIFRGIFTKKEIEDLRTHVRRYFDLEGTYRYGGKLAWRGLHKLPSIAKIVINDRLLDALSSCTGPDVPVLTGECDLQLNTLSRWHKDIDDEGQLKEFAYRPDGWHVYKAAIYLQDQLEGSPLALKVRPGSQRRRLGEMTAARSLAVQAGDLIVFDVRIDHAGQFPSYADKLLHRLLMLSSRLLKRDPEQQFALLRSALAARRGGMQDRMAVYFTFGRPNQATYSYEQAGRRNHGPLPADLDVAVRATLSYWNIGLIEPGN